VYRFEIIADYCSNLARKRPLRY